MNHLNSLKIWLIVGLVIGSPLLFKSTIELRANGLSKGPFLTYVGVYLNPEILWGLIEG